ncbi:MAG: chalcone isomerase family protein [Planctomycetes bacterium]|nr:chalcone isomerase family protein [Planctomycetota bacterium]
MKFSRAILTVFLVGVGGAGVLGAEMVGVGGSDVQFGTPMDTHIAGKPVRLVLTGTAERKKLIFNVYAIGSYVQEGANLHSAEELAAANCPKQLQLVMERSLSASDLAEAFRAAIRLNYPDPAFTQELDTLTATLQAHPVQKDDQIVLTYIPQVGLQCTLVGKADVTIPNVNFAKAVWDIYLGPNNLGEGIKRALVSRL